MLQLDKGARDDERGHFFLGPEPVLHSFKAGRFGYREAVWSVPKADGERGWFVSRWWFGHLQYYRGDAKCDGTRTRMYWQGQLDDGQGEPYQPHLSQYVYTDLPRELWAFRWRQGGPGEPRWDNMGGS